MPKRQKPASVSGATIMATLHEARDVCDIAGVPVVVTTLALVEGSDVCSISGPARESLALAEARDTAMIAGTVAFLTTGQLALSEAADSCSINSAFDFTVRRSLPGVVRWHKFNSGSTIAEFDSEPIPGYNSIGPTYVSSFADYSYGQQTNFGGAPPTIDTAQKPSGSGSVRMDIIGQQGVNGTAIPGFFLWHFSGDMTRQFGAGERFFVQWRQRFDSTYLTQPIYDTSGSLQGGLKQCMINTGGAEGQHGPNSMQVVVQTWYQARFPTAMCDIDDGPTSAGLWAEPVTSEQYQNVPSNPFCDRNAFINGGYTGVQVAPGCFPFRADEWLTFQQEIDLRNSTQVFDAPSGRYKWINSEYRLWGARENQASVLLIDWKPGVPGYFPLDGGETLGLKYGKFLCIQHITSNGAQAHPTLKAWYDELIVSTARLPDPAAASTQWPTWRLAGTTVGSFYSIAGTERLADMANMPASGYPYFEAIEVWNGFTTDGTSLFMGLSSGDGDFPNGFHKIDLSASAPRWQTLNVGTQWDSTGIHTLPHELNGSSATASMAGCNQQYYYDGLPTGRHTYWHQQWVSATHAKDGVARVMFFGSSFPAAQPFGPFDNHTVDSFNLSTRLYDAALVWPLLPPLTDVSGGQIRSICKHPITEVVYICCAGTLVQWTPSTSGTGTYTEMILNPPRGTSQYSGGLMDWHQQASVVDVARARLVCLYDHSVDAPGTPPVMQYIDLSTSPHQITNVPMTGTLPSPTHFIQGNLVHDLDNDRYLFTNTRYPNYPTGFLDVYSMHPVSGVCTLLGSAPAPYYSAVGKFVYMQQYGCCMYQPWGTSYGALTPPYSPMLFMPTRTTP